MTRYGYARVSTEEQREALDAQVTRLKEQGHSDVVMTDVASGKLASRPHWDALLSATGKGDVILAVKLDRVGRSVRHLTELADDLERRGVDLVMLDQPIDTTTAAGKLFFRLLAAFAEFEADMISERTRDGLKAAARKGHSGGRPRALKPYQVKHARREIDDGRPVTEVAEELGVSRQTLYRELGRAA